MDRSLLARLCGVGAVLIGLTVLAGWALHIPVLTQVRSDWTAMVINTALCLTLAGITLILPETSSRWNIGGRRLVGATLLVLGTLVLIENLFDINLGVDWSALHHWLSDPNPHAGRMAPNTSAGFILIGLTLLFFRANGSKSNTLLVRTLAMAGFVVGFTGIVGYWLKPEFLYDLPRISRMALHAAIGITLLSLGWWLKTSLASDSHHQPAQEGRDIFVAAAYALIVVTLVAGISGFAFMQNYTERMTIENLERMHSDRSQFFENVIAQRTVRAQTITTRPGALAAVKILAIDKNNTDATETLRKIAQSYLPHGFTWVAYYQNGRLLANAGEALDSSLFQVTLANTFEQQLIWGDGYYLRTRLDVVGAHGTTQVVTEQPLEIITHLSGNANVWGETGEMGVCDLRSNPFRCFPTRFIHSPFLIPHSVNGKSVPMSYAVSGKHGTISSTDYRRQAVLAAYGPIGKSGMGMVLKMDWAELYAPIREQLQQMLLTLLAITVIGLLLVRARLRPLVKQLVESRRAAKASEARFIAASESSLDAFYILESVRDADNIIVDFRFTYVNNNGAKLISRKDRQAFLGQQLCELLPLMRSGGFFDRYKHVAETGEPLADEFPISAPHVNAAWLGQQVVRLGDGIAITARDITSRKAAEEKLKYLAQNDVLTGLPNRTLFFDRVQQAMVRAKRNQRPMALFYMDIDHFKQINDTLGHASGDALLCAFAERLRAGVREVDTIARLGGDEFTAIIEDMANEEDVAIVAKRIIASLKKPVRLGESDVVIASSIGIAVYPAGGSDLGADALLDRADRALYEVKRRGRNDYAVYEEAMDRLATRVET